MWIPRYFLLARAVTARTQPAGARGFDPSVIDARAWLHGRACLSFTRTRTHVRTGAQSFHPSSISLSRVKSERKLLPVTDRWKQLWFRCDISKKKTHTCLFASSPYRHLHSAIFQPVVAHMCVLPSPASVLLHLRGLTYLLPSTHCLPHQTSSFSPLLLSLLQYY